MKFLTSLSLSLLPSLSFSRFYSSSASSDEVTNLPGAEGLSLTFSQYSGYLPISSTKLMHYWFVESMSDPVNDPVAFWTNGGPGCSGLLGFLTEQGPFRPQKDMTVTLNEYAWNKISNMFSLFPLPLSYFLSISLVIGYLLKLLVVLVILILTLLIPLLIINMMTLQLPLITIYLFKPSLIVFLTSEPIKCLSVQNPMEDIICQLSPRKLLIKMLQGFILL